MEKWKKTFSNAVEVQKELGTYVGRAVHEDLNPLKVLDLFRRISDEVRYPSDMFGGDYSSCVAGL
jgi:DNA-directed RNA polymerase III subunit RPC1